MKGFSYQENHQYILSVEDRGNNYKLIAEQSHKQNLSLNSLKGKWQPVNIANLQLPYTEYEDLELIITKKGFGGNIGCNLFSANVQIEDTKFKVNSISARKRMCDKIPIEKAAFSALYKSDAVESFSDSLFFYAKGKLQLSFVKQK